MLSLRSLRKSFGERCILRDVSFEVHDGELTILEGANGSGKSTLFNILSTHIVADGGEILYAPCETSFSIALLNQDPNLSTIPSLNVRENFALALLKHRRASLKPALRPKILARIEEHIEYLNLDLKKHLDRPVRELSGGQRQMVAFAMATIKKPHIILLDEPTAALDQESSHMLMQIVKRLISSWQIPCLMISHDHALNQHYADKIVILKDGMITRGVLA